MSDVRRVLAREEEAIHRSLIEMGELACSAIDDAATALDNQNKELARQVIEKDKIVNDLQLKVDEECVETIARQQPVATDLRSLVAAMHMSVELERIADHAADVCKIVEQMNCFEKEHQYQHVVAICRTCSVMLRQVMEAYENSDADMALDVAKEDDLIDQAEKVVMQELLERIKTQPDSDAQITCLLWISHNLERIGDRVTNIAERIVYMITGEHPDLN